MLTVLVKLVVVKKRRVVEKRAGIEQNDQKATTSCWLFAKDKYFSLMGDYSFGRQIRWFGTKCLLKIYTKWTSSKDEIVIGWMREKHE